MLFKQIQQLYLNVAQALNQKQAPDGEMLTTKAWLNQQQSLEEAQKSLLILKNILEQHQQDNPQALLRALIEFLKNRDLDVTRKNIGYSSLPQSTMNLLCKNITEIICQELMKPDNKTLADEFGVEFKDNKITNKARYKILMHSLKITGVHRVYNYLEDDDLPEYGGFLLSEKLLFEGEGCVINYQETLTLCRDLFTFTHLFYASVQTSKKSKFLIPNSSFTAGEVARLREFTPQGKYFFQSRDAAKESLEKGATTRIKLNLLITALQQGSVTQNKKFDEEFGESGAIGLAEFYQYWHHLPADIKVRLGDCQTNNARGRNGGTTLAFELNLLERWLKQDTQNMSATQKTRAWQEVDDKNNRPCIDTIQYNLLNILSANNENSSVLDEVPERETNAQKKEEVEPPLDIKYGKDGLLPEYPLDKIFTDICLKVTELRQCTEIMAVLGLNPLYKTQQQQLRTRFIALMNELSDTEDKGTVLFNRLYELNNDGEQFELCAQLIDAIGSEQLKQWRLNEEYIQKIIKHIYEKKNIVKGYEAFNKLVTFNDFIYAMNHVDTLNETEESKNKISNVFYEKYQARIRENEINDSDIDYVVLLKAAIENNKYQQSLLILKHFLAAYNNNQVENKKEIFKSVMYLIMDIGPYDLFEKIKDIIVTDGYLEVLKNEKNGFFNFVKFSSRCINNSAIFDKCKSMIEKIIANNSFLFTENVSRSTPFILCCHNDIMACYILDDYIKNFSKSSKAEQTLTIKKILSMVSNLNVDLSEELLDKIEIFLNQHLTQENIPADLFSKLCSNISENRFTSREKIIDAIIKLDPSQLIKRFVYQEPHETTPLMMAIINKNQTIVKYLCKTFHNNYQKLPGDKFQEFFTIDDNVLRGSLYSVVASIVNEYRIITYSQDKPTPEVTNKTSKEYWLDYLSELYYSSHINRDRYLVAYNRLCSADDGKDVKQEQKQRVSKILKWIESVKAILQPLEDAARSQDPGRYALKYIRSIHENYGLRHWLPKLLTLPFVVMDLIPRWEQKDEYHSERNQLYNFLFSIYEECMLRTDTCRTAPSALQDHHFYDCYSMLNNQDHMNIYNECHDYANLLYNSRVFIALVMVPSILLVLVKSSEIKLLKKPFSFLEACIFGRYQSTKEFDNRGPLADLFIKLFEELYVVTQSDQIKPLQKQLENVSEITADTVLEMLTVLETLLKDYLEKIDTLPSKEVIKAHELPQFSPENFLEQMEEARGVGSINNDANTKVPLLMQANKSYGSASSSASSSSARNKKSTCQIM
jgi:hypothetical protein